MRNLLFLLMVVAFLVTSCNQPKSDNATMAKAASFEEGDANKARMCKEALLALGAGDVDAFTSMLTDSAVFAWNNGDSIAGKAAIVAYWKDRRGNVIDNMQFSNDVWMTLKANSMENVTPGEYVLGWFKATVSYKGGKSMTQWIHNAYFFNAAGKVTRILQFVDRAPIMAAMPPPPPAKK